MFYRFTKYENKLFLSFIRSNVLNCIRGSSIRMSLHVNEFCEVMFVCHFRNKKVIPLYYSMKSPYITNTYIMALAIYHKNIEIIDFLIIHEKLQINYNTVWEAEDDPCLSNYFESRILGT